MVDNTRRCALPGCDATIEDVAGRPARRYCTAAHRSAARQARRASMQSGADEQLTATLPWLREPDPDPRDAAPAVRPVVTPVVPQPAGLRNRAERRRAARSETPPGRRTPGLHVPVSRRRRALAVLGAAGILAGGYVVTASAQPLESSTVAAASEEDWARDARVTLASVNRQLDALAAVEAEWNQLPAAQRAAGPAAPVAALAERRELLENRRAILRSQLETFEQLDGVRAELAESERRLAEIETTLAAAPPVSQRTREQAVALATLAEQRDLLIRQRDAKRDELAALEGGVQDATARPLPDDVQQTEQVGEQVRQVIRGEDVPVPTPDQSLPPRPDVTSGRDEQEGSPRQDVDTSGPPDPRGPGDETVDVPPPPAPADPPAADRGPVDQLAQGLDGTVDTVLGGGDARDGDRGRSADRPADPGRSDDDSGPGRSDPPPAADRGPVESVVDTVGDVVDGPDEKPAARPADRDRPADPPRSSPAAAPDDDGPVEEVVDTVGGLVDGPDQQADEARQRERDKGERDRSDAERSAGETRTPAAPADAPDTVVSPVLDTADDTVAPRQVGLDDRYPDAPADLRAAPAPQAAAPPAGAGPAAAPSGDAVRADDVRAAEAALAVEIVRATPAAAWAAPLVEAAVEEAARQQAAEPSATADPGPRPSAAVPTGSVEEQAAAAALAMWGFDDADIDAINAMAAAAGRSERIPTPDRSPAAEPVVAEPTAAEPAVAEPTVAEPTVAEPTAAASTAAEAPAAGTEEQAYEQAVREAYGLPAAPAPDAPSGYEDTGTAPPEASYGQTGDGGAADGATAGTDTSSADPVGADSVDATSSEDAASSDDASSDVAAAESIAAAWGDGAWGDVPDEDSSEDSDDASDSEVDDDGSDDEDAADDPGDADSDDDSGDDSDDDSDDEDDDDEES